MDFTSLDARGQADVPRAYHLRDQITGEPLMSGKLPCIVMVRGTSSRTVQAAIKARARADMAGETKDEARTLEDIHADQRIAAARLIAGFENVSRGDKPATVDDVEWFLDLNFFSAEHQLRKTNDKWTKPSFAQQIIEFATDDSRFLGRALPA